jgi:hypothetical protein
MHNKLLGTALSGAVLLGCGTGTEPASEAPRGFQIAVAPLNLPGIGDACYDLRVSGATGTVWSEGNPSVEKSAGDAETICASNYGNATGGDITFIGACSASPDDDLDPATAGTQNRVTLWVDGLYAVAGGSYTDLGDYQNPCTTGCNLDVTCKENEDTAVNFDLTIMRKARQGFFDVAVNFEDIFCSAKVDCRESPQGLLFNAGVRDDTIVIGRACTAGPGSDTRMLLSETEFYCPSSSYSKLLDAFNPGADGNQGDPDAAATVFFENAIYSGYEQLATGGASSTSLGKVYVNQAIGVNQPPNADCFVRGYFTVYDANKGLPEDPAGAGFGVYASVHFDVKVVTGGTFGCEDIGLDDNAGVATQYISLTQVNDVNISSLPSGLFDGSSTDMAIKDCAQNVNATTTKLEACGSGTVAVTVPDPELTWDPNNVASLADGSAIQFFNVGTLGSSDSLTGVMSFGMSKPAYLSTAAGVKYLSFNGSSSYIQFPQYNFGSIITANAWISPNGAKALPSSINTLFANGFSGGGSAGFRAFWTRWNTDSRDMNFEGEASTGGPGVTMNTVDGVVTNNKWQMLTYVVDIGAQTVKMYVDGVLKDMVGTGPLRPNIDMNRAWRIGAMRDGHFMKASLGRFSIWRSALSASQIAAYYDATKALYPNP